MKVKKNCRICKKKIKKIISFKRLALVGNFFKKKTKSKKYPISLNYCQNCKHVQIAEIVDPSKLFSKYLWETSASKTNYILFNQIYKIYKNKINKKNTKIIEIASNDGSFLKFLRKKTQCKLVGIDPAKNLATEDKNIKIIKDFFNFKKSKLIKKIYGEFDFIFARNVLAHIEDPNEFFLGFKEILKSNGKLVIEVPYLLPIIKNLQYDNIFHEHIGFYSIKSINDLCNKNSLNLKSVKFIKSQGGSIRCEIIKSKKRINSKIKQLINFEKKNKLFNNKYLINFGLRIKKHQISLKKLLIKLKKKNYKVSIYGASGKGQALLQFCGINDKIIDKAYDISNLKNKRYTPGTNIKIENPKLINKSNIDFLLLLAWNLRSEILNQEKNFIKNGGKFIIPFPYPRIVTK